MATKLFSSWVKGCSWLALSVVAVLGYLSQREWFTLATNAYVVGAFEGVCGLIGLFIFVNKYGDSIAETYLGLRELGRMRKHKLTHRKKAN